MPSIDLNKLDLDDVETVRMRKLDVKTRKPSAATVVADLIEHDVKTDAVSMGAGSGFTPTFSASRHERLWLIESLTSFYDTNLILDVLAQVKGGKEATVYCCSATPATGEEYLAAKVYRPRMFRTLKNDALYREGREARDDTGKVARKKREMRAIAQKSAHGQELLHLSWLYNEAAQLSALAKVGVPVPRMYGANDNALLMTYLGEPGLPAPMLCEVRLPADEALRLFDQLIDALGVMLANNCIHADLSAFNVLYWDGEITIIDFPQAVDAFTNPSAYALFARDVRRICEYFTRYGRKVNAEKLAAAIWKKHMPGATLDIQADRVAWVEARAAEGAP
jgi:RIO kinase 1